jgi:proteasome lid subunit RPN8/RPN11
MPRRFGLTAPELRQLDEVRIEAEVRAALLTAARPATGEACAALYGTPDGPQLTVGAWRLLPNADPGDCLTISVADLLEAGSTSPPGRLVGLFHSHPRSQAVPSDLDRLAIARLPFVWAIAGPGDRQGAALRFFAWSGAGLRELRESSVRTRLGPCRTGVGWQLSGGARVRTRS